MLLQALHSILHLGWSDVRRLTTTVNSVDNAVHASTSWRFNVLPGIIWIETGAVLQATNKEQSIKIQSSGGLSNDQVEQMVRDGEQYAEADKTRKAMIEARNEAETSIYSSEKSLSEYRDKIPQVRLAAPLLPP